MASDVSSAERSIRTRQTLRRLPAYGHLPEEHPPRGETYAQAQRRFWGRRPSGQRVEP